MTYNINAKDLQIAHGKNPNYWSLCSDDCSGNACRTEVMKLLKVCWFDIQACVPASNLRRNACYSAYLLFKLDSGLYGLEKAIASVRFKDEKIHGTGDEGYTVFIDKSPDCDEPGRFPERRNDEWMELNLGDFVNNKGSCSKVEIRLFETKNGQWKSGIVIKGIELRSN